jgi:hypothetical protein
MRKSSAISFAVCLVLVAVTAAGNTNLAAAADTHTIKATSQITWTYNDQASKRDGTPLVVDDLKVGDVVEIQIDPGPISHGFVTIKMIANLPPSENETKDLVLACGENKNAKPNAVLQELDCGAGSKFGVRFTGSMRLEVLDTFKAETNFWCVVHHFGMTGTLKLKP